MEITDKTLGRYMARTRDLRGTFELEDDELTRSLYWSIAQWSNPRLSAVDVELRLRNGHRVYTEACYFVLVKKA